MESMNVNNLFTSSIDTQGRTDEKKIVTPGGDLGQDQFLKLLTTQLQNQDPLEPQASSDFIAQLATFSSLEKLTSIESLLKQTLGINPDSGSKS